MTQQGDRKVASAAMLSRVIFDVQRDLVQILHQRGGAALIKITSVLWVDNTFAVSAVVVDDRQKAVGCEKTHKSDITPFVLIFAVYQLNDTPDILRVFRFNAQNADRQMVCVGNVRVFCFCQIGDFSHSAGSSLNTS